MQTRSLGHASRFRRPRITAAWLVASFYCGAAPAQVAHTCQVDGRVVYQSSPCPAVARVASTAPAPAPSAPAGRKKKSLGDLLRERDAEDRDRSSAPEIQRDGAEVLPARMGAV